MKIWVKGKVRTKLRKQKDGDAEASRYVVLPGQLALEDASGCSQPSLADLPPPSSSDSADLPPVPPLPSSGSADLQPVPPPSAVAEEPLVKVRIVSENAGQIWFGREVNPAAHAGDNFRILETGLGTKVWLKSWFQEVSGLVPKPQHKGFNQLSRLDLKQFLLAGNCFQED